MPAILRLLLLLVATPLVAVAIIVFFVISALSLALGPAFAAVAGCTQWNGRN